MPKHVRYLANSCQHLQVREILSSSQYFNPRMKIDFGFYRIRIQAIGFGFDQQLHGLFQIVISSKSHLWREPYLCYHIFSVYYF